MSGRVVPNQDSIKPAASDFGKVAMSRFAYSEHHHPTRRAPDSYERRFRRIAGFTGAPLDRSTPILPRMLLTAIASLAVVAGLAVSLAVWRIYHFPH